MRRFLRVAPLALAALLTVQSALAEPIGSHWQPKFKIKGVQFIPLSLDFPKSKRKTWTLKN